MVLYRWYPLVTLLAHCRCYREISVVTEILSHPLVVYIFAGDHAAQTGSSGQRKGEGAGKPTTEL